MVNTARWCRKTRKAAPQGHAVGSPSFTADRLNTGPGSWPDLHLSTAWQILQLTWLIRSCFCKRSSVLLWQSFFFFFNKVSKVLRQQRGGTYELFLPLHFSHLGHTFQGSLVPFYASSSNDPSPMQCSLFIFFCPPSNPYVIPPLFPTAPCFSVCSGSSHILAFMLVIFIFIN
jgi:hypothetical protein